MMERISTETYEHTINGLRQKRREILSEMAAVRERLGMMANDVEAIDRVLERLGYDTTKEEHPEAPRFVVFYRGQLRQWIVDQLREHGPATAHQLADRMLQEQNKDTRDRRLVADVTRRIAKAFVGMHSARLVTKHQTSKRGENTWQLI